MNFGTIKPKDGEQPKISAKGTFRGETYGKTSEDLHEKEVSVDGVLQSFEAKPVFNFGGDFLVGFKVSDHVSISGTVGAEMTKIKITQAGYALNVPVTANSIPIDSETHGFYLSNGVDLKLPFDAIKKDGEQTIDLILKSPGQAKEISGFLVVLKPGVNITWYITEHFGVGFSGKVIVGLKQIFDSSYFGEGFVTAVKDEPTTTHHIFPPSSHEYTAKLSGVEGAVGFVFRM
jgi:hypothetical protein